MDSKPFKSINEQIDILINRGLTVNDRPYAYRVLFHINYYRLSGYTLTLRKNDEFYKNVTLEQVMQIYNFDAELRGLLLYFLENIEVSFRAHLGYFHSDRYDRYGHRDAPKFVEC